MKKILCLFLACCISCTVLVLPASAELSVVEKNTAKYYASLYDLIMQYKNNEIELDTLLSEAFSNYMEVSTDNVAAGFTKFADLVNSIGNLGFDVSYEWFEWNYEKGGGIDDSILNGYGAVCISTINSSGKIESIKYADYGILYTSSSQSVMYNVDVDYQNGSIIHYDNATGFYFDSFPTDGYRTYTIYGDWRYEDGTSAVDDNKVSDLPEKEIPNFDDDSVSDDDLIDFLEDLLQDLMLKFPDLSTVEGLLRAILAQLGTLDSDNDNELLSHILTAIEALKTSETGSDNTELIQTLEGLKNALVIEDEENVLSSAELLKQLCDNQIQLSEITIDESIYNQRFELIQTKLLGKFSFIDEMKSFIEYALNAYSSSTSPIIPISFFGKSYNIDFSAFDGSIDLFRFLLAAFCYLSYAFTTFRKIPGYINGGDNT